jgi:membrane peptidoglycan carboxypeptidase
MNEERIKILEMLGAGKITAAEADALLRAVEPAPAGRSAAVATTTGTPRYLRVQIDSAGTNVNVRVPLQLVRSGIKIASLMPQDVQDKVTGALKAKGLDIDVGRAKAEDINALIESLSELTMEIDEGDGGDKVRIFCE